MTAADAQPGRAFLAERGFELADAAQFGIGYAPAEWMPHQTPAARFTVPELLLGAWPEGRQGPIDRFHGPVADQGPQRRRDRLGARKLAADDNAQVPEHAETMLFKKSSCSTGDLASGDRQAPQAVIVEGYTDVMACHLAGITTAVATSGTSFGDGHIGVLRRLLMDESQFRGEVIFTFDGDAAGQRAALRRSGWEEKFVTQTFVAVQPDGLDPCDLRLKHGDAAVRNWSRSGCRCSSSPSAACWMSTTWRPPRVAWPRWMPLRRSWAG